MRLHIAMFVLAACGRSHFERRAEVDASVDAAPTSCWPAWQRSEPVVHAPELVAELAAPAPLGDPSLANNDLELYFTRGTITNGDIYVATRPDRASPWSTPRRVDELDTAGGDLRITIGASGLTIFATDRGGQIDLWQTMRAAPGEIFTTPMQTPLVSGLNTAPVEEHNPELSADELSLYYAPITTATGVQQLVRATRATTSDPFSNPTQLTELAVLLQQGDPSPSPDELVIVYTARDNMMSMCSATLRCYDLFYATRASKAEPFGTPREIPNVNSLGHNDADPEISSDGCELYFTSFRSGTAQLWRATIEPSF